MPPIRLEQFDPTDLPSAATAPRAQATAGSESFEAARLAGYETGYQAGWDDAVKTETEEQSRIGADFARNLQDLGFTFHEARSHVMHALEPLLTGMVEKILPRAAADTMGQIILEELLPLAATASETPIEVVVAPSSRPAIEDKLQAATAIPFSLVEEPTLADGQVFLRSGTHEKHIDLTGAVERIGTALRGLYELNEKAFHHG